MKRKIPEPVQLPSGMWRCQVRVDGERISVTDKDRGKCQAKAVALQVGAEKPDKKDSLSLSKAITFYIESKSNTLSPSTVRGYEYIRKNRFQGIMQKNIYSLTKKDVQIAVNQEAKKYAPKTVANAYGLIRPVLKEYGVDVFGIKLPQNIKKKRSYVQPEEIGKLLEYAAKDRYEVPILLSVWLGMRRSEICGLCWDCVDEAKSTITIRRALVMDKDNHFVLKEGAKNVPSQRTIPCPEYIMKKLSDMRNGKTDGKVFRINPGTILEHVHMVCEKAGITDTTTHGLRHTNAAVMRHLEISDAHAMERGGWSEEATYKKVYSYVFDSQATSEDKKIDDFFTQSIK